MEYRRKQILTVSGIEVKCSFIHETKTDEISELTYKPVSGNWGEISAYNDYSGGCFEKELKEAIANALAEL